jgi:hypothetical protein
MKDPEFLATAEKAQMELNPVDGDGAAKIARDIKNAPNDAIELAKKMIDIE